MDTHVPPTEGEVSQLTKTSVINKFEKKIILLRYTEDMERMSRFVYLGDFSSLVDVAHFYSKIMQTKHGVFVFLKKQYRVLRFCEKTGANCKNMLFFEDSALKTNGIISLLSSFETTVQTSEKNLTMLQTILLELNNNSIQDIIAMAYHDNNLKKIEFIYNNGEAIERFVRLKD